MPDGPLTGKRQRIMTSTISGNGNKRGHSIKGKAKGRMLTVSEVASLMNAHPNSVRCWANLGLLSSYRIGVRGDRRFTPDALDEFLVRREAVATSRA